METARKLTEKDDNGPKSYDDVSTTVACVLDDICQKVVSAEQTYPDAEPNTECDELPFTDSPDIDIEKGSVISILGSLSKQDTVFMKNGKSNNKNVDNGDEREPLSSELEQGNRILKEIMSEANKSVNWAFMEVVDAEKMGLYDYYERIKKPMWLKKMKQKFDDREYATVTEFAGDFRLMLENCYRYNGPDHYVSKRGQRLETMFEQKLSLLSRDLREKTSISATTGQNMEERIISGTRRRKVLVPHDSTALLNQLRLEEKEREREQRRQQMLEKQKEREEFEQTLQGWEDELLEQPIKDYMRTMWEIPAIGHFLFLCTVPLNLGEVMHWELERCFAMPRESLTMQTVMTSLLSTPYQRTKLDKKPLMPYKVWEEKLRVRVRQWYKVYKENNRDLIKTLNKVGLEEKFFKVVGHKNPLEKKKYHELTFYQKVWIMKGLCDWCMETQESIRESIESQPVLEQRSYPLGSDTDGNMYLHFPQFCGQDVRVYRQAPIKMPKLDKPKPQKQQFSITVIPPSASPKKRKVSKKKRRKKKKEEVVAPPSPTPRSRHSRLRQNPKQISPASTIALSDTETTTQSSDDSGISENETDDGQPAAKKNLRIRKPIAFEQSDNDSREATPVSFFRSRFAALERIKDTPSRESTPVPSPIPTFLTRPQQLKDDSSRASTPNSEISSPGKCGHGKGRGRGRKRRGCARNSCRKVRLDEDESNSNLPETNGSTERNADMNESSLMEGAAQKESTDSLENLEQSKLLFNSEECNRSEDAISDRTCVNKVPSQTSSQDNIDADNIRNEIDGSKNLTIKSSSDSLENDGSLSNLTDNGENKENSSHADEGKDCASKSSRQSPTSCDSPPVDTKRNLNNDDNIESGKDDGDKNSSPFDTKSEGIEQAMDCGRSTSGIKNDIQLPIKEECNDSASTSPYSVSEMSIEMVTMEDSKTSILEKVKDEELPGCDLKQSNAIKAEKTSDSSQDIENTDQSESEHTGKVKMEKTESDDVKPKLEAEMVDNKPTVNDEVNKEEMKSVVKEEETAEESEDEEPEITEPEPGEFELVVENLDDLRDLIKKFAEPEPIIEKKGKKEKIIQPPPRKRCEKELHDRLEYLLTELEPWEQKLLQANKRAKIRLRKEHESYVEEPEPKEDVWNSEEEVEESSDDGSDEDSSDSNAAEKNEDTRPKRSMRKRVMTEIEKEIYNAELPDELGISSRGRIRKRRIIPNNIEDQGFKKRRKEPDHSHSPTPNILQRSKSPASAPTSTAATPGQPQYKAVLNQLHMPASLNTAKGGFQLLSINNQMVLVSTGPEKDKSGKPVPTTQPTVLAHISGTSQPVALPLSVVTALQTQAKLQQQQQQKKQQPQSTTATAEQQPHKNVLANKTTVSNTISSGACHIQTTSTDSVSVSSVNTKVNSVPAPITSTVHSQTKPPVPSSAQQSPNKPVDPKLLQQLLFQQGKITVGSATVTVPQVTAVTTSTSNSTRPQFYQYNNIAKLPSNIVQQLMKTTSPQQVKRVRPPITVAAIAGSTQSSTMRTISTGNTSGTALTNLIPAGLMPQAPKVTTLVASTQSSASVPQANVDTDAQAVTVKNVAKSTNILKISTENLSNTNQNNSRSDDANATTGHIVTVSVSPSGAITSSAKSSEQVKQISPELISKLEAHGVSTGKQPNIAAMIQANPGLFKSLGSPPKQKYASNVTVKSLLEKRALENMKQKQTDGSDTQADEVTTNISQQTMEAETLGSKTAMKEANQMQFLSEVSPVPPKPDTKLSPGTVSIRLQSPTAVGNAALAQVMPRGAIRKIQLNSPTQSPQNQVKTQIVQQAATSQIQTVTVNPSSNMLTIPQNLTPQQIQLLQQELVTKFGVQNIPQNIQVVQQVPQQPEAVQTTNKSSAPVQVQQPQTVKQIKVPSGTVTIQPKIIVSGTSSSRNITPKDTTQTSESVIDNALKTVMTTVQTSLPTAQIKVNSPFAAATRNVTMATSAMKSPIPAVPAVEAMSLSPTKTVPVTAINHSLTSTTATSTVTSCVVTSPPSTIIKTAGANAIKIIPDANPVAATSNTGVNSVTLQAQKQITNSPASVTQGTGAQKNVIIQMKQQGAQGVALLQNTVHSVNSVGTSKPGITSIKQGPQTVHNLLLQQKKEAGNVKLVTVAGNSSKSSSVVIAASSSPVSVTAAASTITSTGSVTKARQLKVGGKIPLSPNTKISSLPYMKPQTIQQIMESKAKASSASQQMKPPQASSPQNKPAVVMPGTVPGAPVRIVQASPVIASPVQEAPSGATVANGVTTALSPNAGSTMTNVMANIGGKMVQLRVAVGPGQNINQILQSPQLQQQLQQLHQSQSSVTVNKPASGLTATTVQQSQHIVHVVQQQQNPPSVATSISSTNAIKLGSKTIRALTNMTESQVQNITGSAVVKTPAAPHILSAKTAAPRAMLNVNQTAFGNPSTQILQTQQTVQLSDEVNVASQNSAANVQQVSNLAGNIGQGKVVLVNVDGQLMAAQAVGGKTVLMPQNVNLVGQNVTGLTQNIPANLVQNVQPKIITAPQAVGAIGVQSVQTQQTTINGTVTTLNGGESQSEDTSTNQIQAQSGIVTSLAFSNAGLAAAPVPTPVPMGSLMMVGSGLMPVPTTQPTGIQTPVQVGPSSIVQVSQPLPSPTFRHNMPQQIHISRQAMAMATPQVAATPQVSSAVAVRGGLEQLALAAAQVQEAMQTGTTLKSIPGSNESQANNNAQLSNEYAALPNGTSLP